VGALLCTAGLGVLALAGASEPALSVGARLGALALVTLLAAVVLGWSAFVPLTALFVASAYATRLYADDVSVDARSPLLAAGLLLTVELGYWSIEARQPLRVDAGEDLRRLGFVLALTLGALAVGAILLAVADLARTGGLAVDLLGAAAAVGALLVVVLFARRPARPPG
jgi:hypothetical protein